MQPVQRLLLRLTLFFSWFISFAAVNFEGANWGLQVGWVMALLFCACYLPTLAMSRQRVLGDRQFVRGRRVLLVMIIFSVLAWTTESAGLTRLPEREMLGRSAAHTGYLTFYFIVFVCVFHALRRDRRHYWTFFRWFFLYPFIFIALWGIYQNLSTYGVVQYVDTLNNNLSTGFTYERFKDAHRVSSVFL